jgi:ubiquinone/menaquinone biosynthesis C-methylase UbiE
LDVATGAGHTALKFAPYVDHVVALDITPEMLDRARRLARDRGLANISTTQAPAEHLPFEPARFDLVTCRIAPHHFEDCPGFVSQAARVLVTGGLLLVQDHLLPENPVAQAEIEDFERMRDPSHKRAFTKTQWREMFVGAGLTVINEETILKRHSFPQWAERQGCSPDVVARLEDHVDDATQTTRQWLDPEDWRTSTASFVNHHLIITGRKA